MANKVAAYRNKEILDFISKWFSTEFDNGFSREGEFVTVADLYQYYHEFTTPADLVRFRMDINTFAKCIVACKILDIGGRFRYQPTYEPSPSAVTRATAI